MRLVTYRSDDGDRAGFLVDGVVVDAEMAALVAGLDHELSTATRSVKTMLTEMDGRLAEVAITAAEQASAGNGIKEPRLGPPIADPAKILCLGLNYRLHADEFGDTPPEVPNVFAKFANSLIGPGDVIAIPSAAREIDFEGELAVVIGHRCRNVTAEDALDYIAGCMAFNDVSAREQQLRTSQWTAGKAIDTFAPCGPALVSLDELGELGALRLRTTLNGELMQDASISEMVHPVPETVAFLSSLMTLTPGDIIATGTPHGVGFRRTPPVFMQPGDVVEVEIDVIGTLVNTVAAEGAAAEPAGTIDGRVVRQR